MILSFYFSVECDKWEINCLTNEAVLSPYEIKIHILWLLSAFASSQNFGRITMTGVVLIYDNKPLCFYVRIKKAL